MLSAQELMEQGKNAGKQAKMQIAQNIEIQAESEQPEQEAQETGIMLGNQADLVKKFQDGSLPSTARANVFGQLIEGQSEQLKRIMPPHLSLQRLREVFVLQLKQTPKLLQCEPVSLMHAVYQAAVLGLEPYSTMGEFYILPYGKEAQVIPGYKGLRKLAMNSGEIASIESHLVYENEITEGRFNVVYGEEKPITHRPILIGERGEIVGAWAMARFVKPGVAPVFEFMSLQDIEHVRSSSKASNNGPWVTHFGEMARKTVLRRLIKSLPLSVTPKELVTALDIDNANHNAQNYIIDVETGEAKLLQNKPAKGNSFMGVE